MKRPLSLLLSLALICALAGCASPSETVSPSAPESSEIPLVSSSPVSESTPVPDPQETPIVSSEPSESTEQSPVESAPVETTPELTGALLVNSYTASYTLLDSETRADGSYTETLTPDDEFYVTFAREISDGTDAKTVLENSIRENYPTAADVDLDDEDDLGNRFSTPVYTASYSTGSNEDFRLHEDLCFVHDGYVYFLLCDCSPDAYGEDLFEDTVEMLHSGLDLFDPAK